LIDSSAYKGGVNLTFKAENFYLQDAVFDPGISFAKAKPYLDRMLDAFFAYGEGKYLSSVDFRGGRKRRLTLN